MVKSFNITSKSTPPYNWSEYIVSAKFDWRRYHQGNGDMWPITWGADGHLYGAAGDK